MRFVPIAALAAVMAGGVVGAQVPQFLIDRDRQLATMAIEAAGRGPATPIPLTGDYGRPLGVAYDQFTTAVVIARARAAAGDAASVDTILAHASFQARAIVVVAYPIDCDGKPNHPTALRWMLDRPMLVEPTVIGEPLRGSAGQALLPGVGVPEDALVVAYRTLPFMGSRVEIDYENPVCRGGAKTARLPFNEVFSRTLAIGIPGIKLPEQFASLPSPTTVRVRLTLDTAGRARFPEQIQGPPELAAAAAEALMSKTYPPNTVNGVPTIAYMGVAVVFTATGAPAPPAPFVPPASPTGGNVISQSSTVVVPIPSTTTALPPVPPAPPGQANAQLTRLAIETGEKGEVTPIPLDVAGPAVHGILFDGFLATAAKARAAFKAGKPIDPASNALSATQQELIVVAFPLACSGKTYPPKDITAFTGGATAGPLRETSALLFRSEIDLRLPGVIVPEGAAARAFANAAIGQGLEVRIRYDEPPCGATDSVIALPIQWVRGVAQPRITTMKLPDGSSLPSPTLVRLRGIVDLNGAYRFPTLADGPPELGANAVVPASTWKFSPYRANGVAIPQAVIMNLTFTASGMPEAAPQTATPAPSTNTGPPVMSSTTVNGRPPGLQTMNEAGLTAATSKCAIATDAIYGLTPGAPVKVGGDFNEGPARERQYLTALRGPNGEGLSISRRGAVMAPDKQTILDLWELTYTGLSKPIQIYLDEYHEDTLKAPQGLTCAAAIGK